MKKQILFTTIAFALSGCGHPFYYSGDPTTSSYSTGPRYLLPTGLVRFEPSQFASGTDFTNVSTGKVRIRFTLPGNPLPKTLVIKYVPSSSIASGSGARPLNCTVTGEMLSSGMREFTCVLPKQNDDDDYRSFYLQSLSFQADGYPGTFTFEASCQTTTCYDSVMLGGTYISEIQPAPSGT